MNSCSMTSGLRSKQSRSSDPRAATRSPYRESGMYSLRWGSRSTLLAFEQNHELGVVLLEEGVLEGTRSHAAAASVGALTFHGCYPVSELGPGV